MRPSFLRRLLATFLLVAAPLAVLPVSAFAFSGLYIFGDSLADTGNNAVFLGIDANQVITDNSYVPTQPYASGRYSNAEIWTVGFATAIGLQATASLTHGNVYAYGGARTRVVGPDGTPPVREQVSTYLAAVRGIADPGALYVIDGGGNNARDALTAISEGAPVLKTVASNALQYAVDVKVMVQRLKAAGAQHIVVWNTPDIAIAPSVTFYGSEAVALAGVVVGAMNRALDASIGDQEGVTIFDAFGLFDKVVADPAGYQLVNVTDACGAVAGCDPSTYLFWDGVHPTSAGHKIIGDAMLATVLVP